MPRKPITPAAANALALVGQTLPEDAARESSMQLATTAYAGERDVINRFLGQIEMAEAGAQFFRTVRTSKLAYIKESKAYRGLQGYKTPDGPEFLGTWAEFCSLLHRSVDQVDEDIRNYRTFAEEALDAMTSAGIGYRELRQLRKLPDDERETLIEVAKAGNTEALIEIAESLITKHTEEKRRLTDVAEKADARVERVSKQLEQQQETVDQLKDERRRLRREWSHKAPDDRMAELRTAVQTAALDVVSAVSPLDDDFGLRGAILALLNEEGSEQVDHSEFLAGVFAELIVSVRTLRDDLPVSVPIREAQA